MKEKTFKCVQCGECIVPPTVEQKNAEPSRTGCVLFHDHRYKKPEEQKESKVKESWSSRIKALLKKG